MNDVCDIVPKGVRYYKILVDCAAHSESSDRLEHAMECLEKWKK